VVVPLSVPPPGLAPRATDTALVAVVTKLPPASSTRSRTNGLPITTPATSSCGCAPKSTWVGGPTSTSNDTLVTGAKPVAFAVSVYPVAATFTLSGENVATPPTAATVVVPTSGCPPGFAPNATVTVSVKSVARFPSASRDRKSTRLNSSHVAISYAVFCLKKKKIEENRKVNCTVNGEEF